METENTRETINMSLTHEDNHDNKDTLNSKDRLLKQSKFPVSPVNLLFQNSQLQL
jgi:hypothetical protein